MTGGSSGDGHGNPQGALGGGDGLDLERLIVWLAEGHVRYLRLRVGGTEVVYARDGTPDDVRSVAPHRAASPQPGAPVTAAAPDRLGAGAPDRLGAPARAPTDVDVVAPMAGIFHHAPAPGAQPYVVPGQQVADTTTVGLMESMKIFTAVAAGVAGVVVTVLAPNGQPVDKGQPLVRLRPEVAAGAGAGT